MSSLRSWPWRCCTRWSPICCAECCVNRERPSAPSDWPGGVSFPANGAASQKRPPFPRRKLPSRHSFTALSDEHRHLRRRSDNLILRPHRYELHRISEALRYAVGPFLKLRAHPLEAMVLVPKRAGGESLELDIVLGIGRRQHDGARPGELEQHTLERGQTRRIEMLDHLHHGGCIV